MGHRAGENAGQLSPRRSEFQFRVDQRIFGFLNADMKILLGCLMCLVLPMSQAFAISGGPPYPIQANIIGTYAGALNPVVASSNTLGIFSVGIPDTGLASGPFFVFTGERTFVGSIQGVGDPDKATLRANLQAIPVVTAGDTTIFTLNFHADGSMNAKVKARSKRFGTTSTRLTGTAHITTTNRNDTPPTTTETDFTVDGFKQSNTANSGSAAPSASPTGG
jgi:hypothetical protein